MRRSLKDKTFSHYNNGQISEKGKLFSEVFVMKIKYKKILALAYIKSQPLLYEIEALQSLKTVVCPTKTIRRYDSFQDKQRNIHMRRPCLRYQL